MLALYFMLLSSDFVENYAGIIGTCLPRNLLCSYCGRWFFTKFLLSFDVLKTPGRISNDLSSSFVCITTEMFISPQSIKTAVSRLISNNFFCNTLVVHAHTRTINQLKHGRECCAGNNGTRGRVSIAIQHSALPHAVLQSRLHPSYHYFLYSTPFRALTNS